MKKKKIFNAKLFTNCNNIFNTGFPPSPGVKQDCYSRHLFFMTQSESIRKTKTKQTSNCRYFQLGFFCLEKYRI